MFVYVSSIITTRQYFIFQEKRGENSDWHYTGITIQQVTSLSRSSGIQRFPLSSQGQTNITFQVFRIVSFPRLRITHLLLVLSEQRSEQLIVYIFTFAIYKFSSVAITIIILFFLFCFVFSTFQFVIRLYKQQNFDDSLWRNFDVDDNSFTSRR